MAPTIVVAGAGAVAFSVWLAISALTDTSTLVHRAAPAIIVALVVWMFFSERYELTLAVLLIYLALFDGFIKLTTNSSVATLGRDALLYAIALGALARAIVSRSSIAAPPLMIGVLVWLLICIAQIANPSAASVSHAVSSIRQHVEFVPLFFFGYIVLRSEQRLAGLFALLVVVAAVNGVVALIQSQLTPSQLANWGPGYSNLMFGTTKIGARVFVDSSGIARVRPPGLGSDFGFAGELAAIALPGAFALIAGARRHRRLAILAWLGLPLLIVAIATSQSRTAVVMSVVAALAFVFLTIDSPRRGMAVLGAVLVVGAVTSVVVAQLEGNHATASNRYASITPAQLIGTTLHYRQTTLSLIPTYAGNFPFGAGMGSVGPAGNSLSTTTAGSGLDAESEITFLEIELGLPGLVAMLVLTFGGLWLGFRLRRVADVPVQRSLMALTAVLFAMLTTWVVGIDSTSTPTAPFFWLATGTLGYWYQEMRAGQVAERPRRVRAKLAGH
jgi:hypothetical protein